MRPATSKWLGHGVRAIAAVGALAAASCNGGGARTIGAAPRSSLAPTRVLVAFGGNDARGIGTDDPLRQSWPQDLFRTLPANYRLVNLGIPDATVATAVALSLPTAISLRPALATIWLNVNDILNQVPVVNYEEQLATLVHALRAIGATVLVANAPEVDDLPGYVACAGTGTNQGNCPSFVPRPLPSRPLVAAAVSAYNSAIAVVTAQEGATLVDIHAARFSATLVAPDGFDPSAAGAQVISNQFAAAFNRP